jgi:hypothetical protein
MVRPAALSLAVMDIEQPRPDANTDETAYSLTAEEAALRYETAGHSRTLRAIQKYCLRGDLDCIKQETLYGQRYRITPESVARHLGQIEEVTGANGRGQSRPDANVRMASLLPANTNDPATTGDEHSRPDATAPTNAPDKTEGNEHESVADDAPVREQPRPDAQEGKYVALLERENDFLRDQISRKDHQIEQRDTQIQSMIERDRETNVLIQGLQRLLRLGSGDPGPSSAAAGDNSEQHQ